MVDFFNFPDNVTIMTPHGKKVGLRELKTDWSQDANKTNDPNAESDEDTNFDEESESIQDNDTNEEEENEMDEENTDT